MTLYGKMVTAILIAALRSPYLSSLIIILAPQTEDDDNINYSRTQFPITLVITVHKAQYIAVQQAVLNIA
jgi:hypothetical protein